MSLSSTEAVIGDRTLRRGQQTVVLTARHPSSDNPAAFPGLARKLPHYGSYSYLAFDGDAPTNTLKGQWQVMDSPLNTLIAQADHAVSSGEVVVNLKSRKSLSDTHVLNPAGLGHK